MIFRIKEQLKSFAAISEKRRVGFVIPASGSYEGVSASTRIRAYDVINAFSDDDKYHLELYRSFRNYDIVIFLKSYDKKSQTLARKLKAEGVKVIFDMNINVFEGASEWVDKRWYEDAHKFVQIVDELITPSVYIQDIIRDKYPTVPSRLIFESLAEQYFSNSKNELEVADFSFVWLGYSGKGNALALIASELIELYEKQAFSLLIISDEDPKIRIGSIPIRFQKFNLKNAGEQLNRAQVFLAPRDLDEAYNKGHSFTKIGIPMAAGVAVIASPVPSYLDSPAVICQSSEEWKRALSDARSGKMDLRMLSDKGRVHCKEKYSMAKVKESYVQLFDDLIDKGN